MWKFDKKEANQVLGSIEKVLNIKKNGDFRDYKSRLNLMKSNVSAITEIDSTDERFKKSIINRIDNLLLKIDWFTSWISKISTEKIHEISVLSHEFNNNKELIQKKLNAAKLKFDTSKTAWDKDIARKEFAQLKKSLEAINKKESSEQKKSFSKTLHTESSKAQKVDKPVISKYEKMLIEYRKHHATEEEAQRLAREYMTPEEKRQNQNSKHQKVVVQKPQRPRPLVQRLQKPVAQNLQRPRLKQQRTVQSFAMQTAPGQQVVSGVQITPNRGKMLPPSLKQNGWDFKNCWPIACIMAILWKRWTWLLNNNNLYWVISDLRNTIEGWRTLWWNLFITKNALVANWVPSSDVKKLPFSWFKWPNLSSIEKNLDKWKACIVELSFGPYWHHVYLTKEGDHYCLFDPKWDDLKKRSLSEMMDTLNIARRYIAIG